MSEPTTTAQWTVDYQNQRTRVNSAQQIEDGYEVTFHTAQGHTGSVFLPDNRYTPANVKAAIQAQADLLDHVGNLTHES